jgi:hypothetical protein
MGNIKCWILSVLGAILLNVAAAPPAFAQAENKTSQVTFASWVEIPDGVLPAGTYIFRLSDANPDQHVVQIYDQVSGILVATRQTVPQFRNNFPPQEKIRFEQAVSPNPPAVKSWFHMGSRMGEGFVYLTRDHQKFYVPVEQPAASLQESRDRLTTQP